MADNQAAVGQPVPRAQRQFGIGGRLLIAFGAVAGFTLVATVVAWVLFDGVQRNLLIITNESIPVTAISFRLSEQSSRLGLVLPNLLAATTEDGVENVMEDVDRTISALLTEAELLNYFGRTDLAAEGFLEIGEEVRVKAEGMRRLALNAISSTRQREAAVAALYTEHERFTRAVGPVLDSTRQEIIASTRDTVAEGATRIGDLIDDSFESLRAVLELQASVYLIDSLIHHAMVDDDPDSIWSMRSEIVAPMATIANALPRLPEGDRVDEFKATAELITRHAVGSESVFEQRLKQLDAAEAEAAAIDRRLRRVLSTLDDHEGRFFGLGEQVISAVDTRILATAADAAREGQGIVTGVHSGIGNLETVLVLRSETNQLVNLLHEAAHLDDAEEIASIEVQFQTLFDGILSNLAALPHPENAAALRPSIDALGDIGAGNNPIFDIRRSELKARRRVQELQSASRELSERLSFIALNLVDEAESAAYAASSETQESIERGETTLITLAGVSFLVALLITWLYVLRVLVRRLTGLASTTLAIAEGQLDTPIQVHGNDEVSDMARALTVFRDNARKRHQAEQQLRVEKDRVEQALSELKAAQENLIQAEKMASLGQLTAGIAHEIKNPLNFVNNFSEVSVELLQEMKEEMAEVLPGLDDDTRADIEDLVETLSGNLARIKEHGARADSIVKGMLSHAREEPGQSRSTDLNALLEESLNLSYHGARAENQSFNVTLEKDLDPTVGEVQVFTQELTRVMLNVIGNAFYAVNKRRSDGAGDDYEPTVSVTTRNLGEKVSVEIRDNGTGIPKEIQKKIFHPFFTTKPTGEGTGLGLSLSYDIVVKQHGGALDLDSRENEYSAFRITLPRKPPNIDDVSV